MLSVCVAWRLSGLVRLTGPNNGAAEGEQPIGFDPVHVVERYDATRFPARIAERFFHRKGRIRIRRVNDDGAHRLFGCEKLGDLPSFARVNVTPIRSRLHVQIVIESNDQRFREG